jgi:hypothetical protein
MTFRERHLAIFRHEPVDRVLWQPRLETWISTNRAQGTLPPRYRDFSHLDFYDDLNCSPRGYFWFNACLKPEQTGEVEVTREQLPDGTRTTTRTPVGTVTQFDYITDSAHQTREFPIKTVADMAVIEYLLRHMRWSWDAALFAQQDEAMGERAAPTIYVPRIAIQRLIIQYTGFEPFHYLYHDHPAQTQRLIETIDETDDLIYDVVCACPVEIINFGDNLAGEFVSPTLFEQWYLPHYQRRSAQLQAVGKSCHSHWDGACKMLLPYARETGMDGLEALTPVPQGDVTLQEIRAALGDNQILIDGIPCTHFMPQHTYDEVADITKEIIDLFAPNLVLGISDEISPPGDIEKVRRVSEVVEATVL